MKKVYTILDELCLDLKVVGSTKKMLWHLRDKRLDVGYLENIKDNTKRRVSIERIIEIFKETGYTRFHTMPMEEKGNTIIRLSYHHI